MHRIKYLLATLVSGVSGFIGKSAFADAMGPLTMQPVDLLKANAPGADGLIAAHSTEAVQIMAAESSAAAAANAPTMLSGAIELFGVASGYVEAGIAAASSAVGAGAGITALVAAASPVVTGVLLAGAGVAAIKAVPAIVEFVADNLLAVGSLAVAGVTAATNGIDIAGGAKDLFNKTKNLIGLGNDEIPQQATSPEVVQHASAEIPSSTITPSEKADIVLPKTISHDLIDQAKEFGDTFKAGFSDHPDISTSFEAKNSSKLPLQSSHTMQH